MDEDDGTAEQTSVWVPLENPAENTVDLEIVDSDVTAKIIDTATVKEDNKDDDCEGIEEYEDKMFKKAGRNDDVKKKEELKNYDFDFEKETMENVL